VAAFRKACEYKYQPGQERHYPAWMIQTIMGLAPTVIPGKGFRTYYRWLREMDESCERQLEVSEGRSFSIKDACVSPLMISFSSVGYSQDIRPPQVYIKRPMPNHNPGFTGVVQYCDNKMLEHFLNPTKYPADSASSGADLAHVSKLGAAKD